MIEKLYKIVRQYENNRPRRVMRKNLTLRQAQEYCEDPETSSMTAKRACNGNEDRIERWHQAQKHWFDGFVEQ